MQQQRKETVFARMIVIVCVLVHAVFSYVFWDINPSNWDSFSRFLSVAVVITFLVCIMVYFLGKHGSKSNPKE